MGTTQSLRKRLASARMHRTMAANRDREVRSHLREVLTLDEPLGPHFTEPLLQGPIDVFEKLYDRHNRIHADVETEGPPYIIGRKGSGKTAFLVGSPLLTDADVVLVRSEDIYADIV